MLFRNVAWVQTPLGDTRRPEFTDRFGREVSPGDKVVYAHQGSRGWLTLGGVDAPALSMRIVAQDALVIVLPPHHPWADGRQLTAADLASGTSWVMREEGSGTRSEFENAVAKLDASPGALDIALVLPSNEAVLSAVCVGQSAAAISRATARAYLGQGLLVQATFDLPARSFRLLRHKERHASKAAQTLEMMCKRQS